MAEAHPARRHNRLIGLLVVLGIGAGVAAWFGGNQNSTPTSPDTTVAQGEVPSTSAIDFARPADVSLSWFNHSNSVEQFDYEMSSLSCRSMEDYITPDLCAVAKGKNGSFMVVGTEGYWDPNDADSSDRVWVPPDLTVYVLAKVNGRTRAMSVLDGTFQVNYDGVSTMLGAYVVETEDGQAIALHKHAVSQAAQAYDFWDELQILAVSPTGAPGIVAAYEGSNIHLTGNGKSVVFSSDRYASPTGSMKEPKWSTFTWLTPNGSDGPWTESTQSGASLHVHPTVKPVLADSYEFPNSASKGSDA